MLPLEEMPIARLGHPARAREMALVDRFRALGFLRRVDAENDRNRLTPISTLGFRIQQAQIGYKMLLVVGRYTLFLRRLGIERRRGHCPITTSTRYDLAKLTTISSIVVFPLSSLRECAVPNGE